MKVIGKLVLAALIAATTQLSAQSTPLPDRTDLLECYQLAWDFGLDTGSMGQNEDPYDKCIKKCVADYQKCAANSQGDVVALAVCDAKKVRCICDCDRD